MTYRFFPTELMFFLLGYVSYRIYLHVKTLSLSKLAYVSMMVFIFLLTIFFYFIDSGFAIFSLREVIYFSSIVVLVPFLFNFFKDNKLDAQLGELSYPVYISHMLIVTFCFDFSGENGLLRNGVVIAGLTVVLSYFLNRWV